MGGSRGGARGRARAHAQEAGTGLLQVDQEGLNGWGIGSGVDPDEDSGGGQRMDGTFGLGSRFDCLNR